MILTVAAMLVAATVAFAGDGLPETRAQEQQPPHEFSLSYGQIGLSEMFIGMGNYTVGGENVDYDNYFGPLNLQYFYRKKPWKLIGIQATYFYDSCGFHYSKAEDSPDGYMNERNKHHCFSLMPAVKYNYLRKKHFGMYSGASLGVLMVRYNCVRGDVEHTDKYMFYPIFQLSLLGLEGGGQRLRGFMDIGFGEQGVLQFGLRYRLD
jgi:hypothetical protein